GQVARDRCGAQRERDQCGADRLAHGDHPARFATLWKGPREEGYNAATRATWRLNSSGGTKPTSLYGSWGRPAPSKKAIVGGPKLSKYLSRALSSSSLAVTSAR